MPKDAIAEKAKDTIVLNKTVTEVLAVLLSEGAHRATKYLNPRYIVRATRKIYRGKVEKNPKSISIELSFGVPNYKERMFIKLAVKAKEPFPIKKVQVQMPPKKRK
jgi:hypothetical protein